MLAVLLTSVAARAETGAASPTIPEMHGFVSQGFIKTTDNNYLAKSKRGSVEFTEVGINFTSSLTDQLRVGVQLFARDLGPIGNYTPVFDWFYLDYQFFDWLGVRAGRTKLPFGLYNETSDIDSARVQILLPQSIYPTQDRDFLLAQTGGELYGNVRLRTAGSLEYRLYGGTIFLDTSSTLGAVYSVDVPYLFGGRLSWQTPLEGLLVSGSVQALKLDFSFTPTPDQVTALQMQGSLPADFTGALDAKIPAVLSVGSLEYTHDDLVVASEYSRWRSKTEATAHATGASLPGLDRVTVSERFYVMASYRLNSWFTPGLYYSALYPNVDDRRRRDAYQHDVAASLRYDLNAHWLLKLEGHFMHGTAGLDSTLNGNVPLASLPKNWGVFLAKTTAYF